MYKKVNKEEMIIVSRQWMDEMIIYVKNCFDEHRHKSIDTHHANRSKHCLLLLASSSRVYYKDYLIVLDGVYKSYNNISHIPSFKKKLDEDGFMDFDSWYRKYKINNILRTT